jgi:hypothetical protein
VDDDPAHEVVAPRITEPREVAGSLGFRGPARAIDERIPKSPGLSVDQMLEPERRALLERQLAFVPAVIPAALLLWALG